MADHKNSKYKRILLKLSGEALMGDMDFGIDPKVLDRMALEIGQLKGIGVQVGLVIGGGMKETCLYIRICRANPAYNEADTRGVLPCDAISPSAVQPLQQQSRHVRLRCLHPLPYG